MVDIAPKIPDLDTLGDAYGGYRPYPFSVTEELSVPVCDRERWMAGLQTHVAPLLETQTNKVVGQCITYNPSDGSINAEAYDDNTRRKKRSYIHGAVRLFAERFHDSIDLKLEREDCRIEVLMLYRKNKIRLSRGEETQAFEGNFWVVNSQKGPARKNPTFKEEEVSLTGLLEREVERLAKETGKDQEIIVTTCRLDELLFYLRGGYTGKMPQDSDLIDQILGGNANINLSGDVAAPEDAFTQYNHADWVMFNKGEGCPPTRKWLDYVVADGGEHEMVEITLSKVFKAPQVPTAVDKDGDETEARLRVAGWID